MLGLTRDPFHSLLGRPVLVNGLAHLRGHHASRIDGKRQLQADAALVLVQGGAARRLTVGEGIHAVGLQLVAAADQVERGEMAAARGTDVFARDVGRQSAGYERKILLQRHVDPAVFADGVRACQVERLDGTGQPVEGVAGDFAQQLQSGGQGALRGNDGRSTAVMGGAGLFHIGDGDQTDLKARLGLIELTLDGGQRDLLRLEIILGGENVEVTLRDALHQVLLRSLVIRFGLRYLGVRALQGHPILPAKQVLLQVDAVLVRGRDDAPIKRVSLKLDRARRAAEGLGESRRPGIMFPGYQAASRELRQQRRERLRLGLQGRQASRLGLAQLGIVLQRALVHREKIGCRR